MSKSWGRAYKNFIEEQHDINTRNCIYLCVNKITGHMYIGRTTTSMKKRLTLHYNHRNRLETKFGIHMKQNDWNDFEWKILHVLDNQDKLNNEEMEELYNLEIYYIDLYKTYNTEYGLNTSSGGRSGSGCKLTEMHKKHWIDSMKKSVTGENNVKAIINKQIAESIKIDCISGIPIKEIALKYGVASFIVSDVTNFHSWKHIRPDLNEQLWNAKSRKKERYIFG